ncbi:CPBP family intramembrane metalloprotease [bacterium]|nr:CPBP family intramembrane metalloprotease [bacterium]
MEQNTTRKPWIFFLLTYAYSWLLWLPSILSGLGVEIPFDVSIYTAVVVPIGAFAPMLAAITLIYRNGRWLAVKAFFRAAFDFQSKLIYYFLAFLLPIVIHAIAHYLAPVMGFEVADTLFPADLPVSPVVLAIPYFFLMLLIGGGQEEFGWRGYAQQPMQERFGAVAASLLIGVIWGFWHLPLWIMPGDGHSNYPFIAFLLMTTSISVVYTWIFNASGKKLIIAIIFHAMNNTAAPLIPFLLMEEGKPESAYWVYAGVNVIFGIIFTFLIVKDRKNE